MRIASSIASLLAVVASAPALADVVTVVGRDTCPANGELILGPGRAATIEGNDSSGVGVDTELFCMPDTPTTTSFTGQPQAHWAEICVGGAVNCSAGNVSVSCVVCRYTDMPIMAAPSMPVVGLVLLASALIGVVYSRRKGRRIGH
jgi:hypothetical protein